jgi:hypothetical protein
MRIKLWVDHPRMEWVVEKIYGPYHARDVDGPAGYEDVEIEVEVTSYYGGDHGSRYDPPEPEEIGYVITWPPLPDGWTDEDCDAVSDAIYNRVRREILDDAADIEARRRYDEW